MGGVVRRLPKTSAPTIDAPEAFERKVAWRKPGHLSVMEETRYPFIPYVSRQRELPQMGLSMAAKSRMPRTGARCIGGRYLSHMRLMQVSLSNRSARHTVSFPLWMYLRPWRGYKTPQLAHSCGVALVINHFHHTWPHGALTNSSYASSPNGPPGSP